MLVSSLILSTLFTAPSPESGPPFELQNGLRYIELSAYADSGSEYGCDDYEDIVAPCEFCPVEMSLAAWCTDVDTFAQIRVDERSAIFPGGFHARSIHDHSRSGPGASGSSVDEHQLCVETMPFIDGTVEVVVLVSVESSLTIRIDAEAGPSEQHFSVTASGGITRYEFALDYAANDEISVFAEFRSFRSDAEIALTVRHREGDADFSGSVDFSDLLAILERFGDVCTIGAGKGPSEACSFDLSGDGVINFADLLLVLANWD